MAEHDDTFGPKIIVHVEADLTPNTLKTIRKNAGRIPPMKLATYLGWTFKRLKAVCDKRHIPLRYPPRDNEAEARGA